MRNLAVLTVFICLSAAGVAKASGDPIAGARAFQQCAACHSVESGRHLTGPSLAHAWGERAGTNPGFQRYSDALQRSGLKWDEATLERWLADPQKLVPGTTMTFVGVRSATARADIIAYLRAVSEGKAPPAPRQDGGMMMGGNEPLDLKKAETDSQVVSMKHCRDTYIVRTADGKTHKVWEYNVRLKTDASTRGPRTGRPVVAGSGMRGDRISVIFASPSEIGRFIREGCK